MFTEAFDLLLQHHHIKQLPDGRYALEGYEEVSQKA
jgi:hypothetical protein